MSNPLEIIILAAGKGSRMKSELPKVLHPIAGKPMLTRILDTANALNPAKIHVVVGHKKDQIIQSINDDTINWVEQTEQLGTGHAVDQALPSVDGSANVLILTGDVPLISESTLADLVEKLDYFPIALLTAKFENPFGLGRILRDHSDAICGIVEEKDASDSQRLVQEINTGVIAAQKPELQDWLSRVENDNAQNEYYLTDVIGLAHQDGALICSTQPKKLHEVIGINSRNELAMAERRFQLQIADELMQQGVTIADPNRIDIRGEVEFGTDVTLDINCVIEGPSKIGNHVSIDANSVIKQSTIGDFSHVHSHSVLEQTILGEKVNVGPFARLRPGTQLDDEVRIGNFVETKNAQLGKGSKANHLSYVGDSVVGQNTNIGAGVITCNYDGANKHKTEIGNDVFIGSDSQLIAPVKIADGATIGAGTTLTNDVDSGQLAISRNKQKQINNWARPKKKSP
jgi:bifunctional UDP-N-acetylglucosamine pyrophosphorylase/glucosamine-1-phosphate N-acetyltransferase